MPDYVRRAPPPQRRARLTFAEQRTLAWVRASCEADHLPDWLIGAVCIRVRAALLANDYPLWPEPYTPPPDLTETFEQAVERSLAQQGIRAQVTYTSGRACDD